MVLIKRTSTDDPAGNLFFQILKVAVASSKGVKTRNRCLILGVVVLAVVIVVGQPAPRVVPINKEVRSGYALYA